MSAILRCQAKNRFYESTQRLIQPRRVLWRTITQEAWTILQNKLVYKKVVSRTARRKIATLAAVFESVDHDFLELREQVSLDTQTQTQADAHAGVDKGSESDLLDYVNKLFPGEPISAVNWQRLMVDLDHLQPDWSTKGVSLALAEQNLRGANFFREYPDFGKKVGRKIRILLYASNPVLFRAIVPISDRGVFDLWRRREDKQPEEKERRA